MLRTYIYIAYLWFTGLLMLLTIGLPAIFNKTVSRWLCKISMTNTVMAAKYILGINYRITGTIPETAAIYACKHQSAWETYFLQMFLKRPTFVLKKELIDLPLIGLYIKSSGQIAIDRSQGSSAFKTMIREIKQSLMEKRNVIIFPEGTRVPPGERIEYKQGISVLYKSLPEIDIIPVSVNSGLLWPKGAVIKKRGCIDIVFHTPIAKNLSREEFMIELVSKIESLN